MINVLVARVFAARNLAHLEHWKTKSYAQHKALNEFYDGIISGIDRIVETYQGAFGLIKVPMLPEADAPKDFLAFLQKCFVRFEVWFWHRPTPGIGCKNLNCFRLNLLRICN